MLQMIWPMLVVIGANTQYNISAKSTPAKIDPFASLAVTYFVGMASSLVLFYVTNGERNLGAELAKTNWASYALGLAVVGLEYGFIHVYRAGWKISTAQLVAAIGLAAVLLLVGYLFYHEHITRTQLIGVAVCAVGLILIAK